MTQIESEATAVDSSQIFKCGRTFVLAIMIGMFGLIGRVVQLKLVPDSRLTSAMGSPMSSRVEITRRGDILDRCGRVIATSTVGYRLFVDPVMVSDPTTIAVDLGKALQADPVAIDKEIAKRPESRYIVIDHQLDDWQVERVRKANLKGIGLEPRLIRHYPHGDLAASVVGKVGFEHTGQAGAEQSLNARLTPTSGKLTYLRDVARRALWIDPADYTPGHDGQDVRLSIDLVVQEFAEKRLRRAVEEFNAGGGRMLVADCRSGEILAMTDILNPRRGWKEQAEDLLRRISPSLGRNRCVSDPYEPGSTFKPFIWSVATELRKAGLNEELPIPDGPWRTPYGRTIHEAHYYGPSTWRLVLVKSMNIGMAMIAERMSHKQMQDALKRFGFGSKTNIGIVGESAGIVTSQKQWRKYTQSSVAMGHEIAVTPVQMVRAFSAFCRDGSMVDLRVTTERTEISGQRSDESSQSPSPTTARAIPENIVTVAREAMKGVIEEGTGRLSQSDRYQLFGKSGTAQLPRNGGKGYWDDRYVASFIAGAPYHEPRIIVLCVIDDPDKRKGHFGGTIAGPAARDVIEQTLNYLGVAPDKMIEAPKSNMVAVAE
jgi:cell division protein FtsI/penicillin-binding protein 2